MATSLAYSKDETNTITLLRVIATVGVLVIHLHQRVPLPGLFGQIASCGADGVKAYFLLTGYLVMNSWQSRKSTKDYWSKRLGRTLPIYYTWLIVLVIYRPEWATSDAWAIPRSVLMLDYLAPPTISWACGGKEILPALSLFMMFYVLIPIIAKFVNTLNDAFFCFWIITILSMFLPGIYAKAYNGFCDPYYVNWMSSYLAASLPYFGAGILIYFGKKDQEIEKLLFYLVFIAATNIYPFLGLSRVGWLVVLIGILLCYPLHFPENLNIVQQNKKINVIKKCAGGGYLRNLDHLGMGVFVSQILCFDIAQRICGYMNWGKMPCVLLMFFLPYGAAFLLYHFVEIPGKKLVDRLMS